MESVAVISSADQKYFPLLLECLESVKQSWPESGPKLTLCAIEAGLEQHQIAVLVKSGIVVAPLMDNIPIGKLRLRGRVHLLATLVRAFLPEYFPGHDIYVWMDADSWACNYSAMALYLEAARKGSMGIVSNFDRYSNSAFTSDRWFFKWAKVRNFYLKNGLRSGLSYKETQKLATKQILYSGNFSLKAGSEHWDFYQENLFRVVKKGRIFGSDQLALGMTIYLDEQPVELLPRWCNWTSVVLPKYDHVNKCFVEYYLPNHPIGIMHLCGRDEMRMDSSYTLPIESLDGSVKEMSLRFNI